MTWVLLVGAAAVGWMIWTFNRLTRLRQLGDNAWADIDVQLKRRHDLIPSVVAVVKGHAGYERETLEALVAARGRAVEAASAGPAARYREEQSVAGGVRNILAVAEAYPELRAAAKRIERAFLRCGAAHHLAQLRDRSGANERQRAESIDQAGVVHGVPGSIRSP